MTEYKRLTQWTEKGASLKLDEPQNELEARIQLMEKFKLACNKLAELEDKIEQGKMLELPCKVGDTVYYETFNQSGSVGVKPHKVIGFVLEVMTQNIDGFGCTAVPIRDFGETVFLTEAEAKLKELQEKEND